MSDDATKPAETKFLPEPAEPILTHHNVAGIEFEAYTGFLPIKNDKGEVEAQLFFMAYFKKGEEPGKRPLMFSFNGGPGSASVWLHLGTLGPKRVKMMPDGQLPPPPYVLEDNPDTWLHEVDLVFIDPVGTGYSRAATPELAEKSWSVEGDIKTIGEFVRLFLTRFERWSSPLYVVGESYGTTRAAGLAGYLIDWGIAFKGVVLVSSILNFQTADFASGNDLPFSLFLPTYAATAYHHGKVKTDKPLREFLKEVEGWVDSEYVLALHQGDRLQGDERNSIKDKLSYYTGLSADYLDQCNLRINIHKFCKELRRSDGVTVGRLDSRFEGYDADGTGATSEHDPSMTAIRPPYTSAINDWIRRGLGFKSDEVYRVLGEGATSLWQKWSWGSARDGFPDTSAALRDAFAKNPHMRVFVASGFFDLATPYYATYYTLDHMGIERFRDNVVLAEYEAGHMMYIDEAELKKLKKDVSDFLKD